MTDRELLEHAAKAAGLTHLDTWSEQINDYDSYHYGMAALHASSVSGQCNSWNPLVDDGDALRLAVRLQLQVTPGTYNPYEITVFKAGETEVHEQATMGYSMQEATRRAIVRAAAEIAGGKNE